MEENAALTASLYLIVGFVSNFFGYRLLRLLVALAGFAIAVIAALFIADLLFVETDTDRIVDLAQTLDELATESTVIGIVVTFFIGIIGAVVLTAFYGIGIALLGAFGASYLTFAVLVNNPDVNDNGLLGAVMFAFIIGGLLALRVERGVIIFSTSIIGAFLMVVGGLGLLDANNISTTRPFGDTEIDLTNGLVLAAIWLVLALLGTWRQFDHAEDEYDIV